MNEETSQNNNSNQAPVNPALNPPEEKTTETTNNNQETENKTNRYAFNISPIRTFGEDVKNAVQQNNISTSKIFMAEQRKREAEQQDEELNDIKQKPNIIKTVLSIIFILLGLGSIFYVFAVFLPQKTSGPMEVVLEKNSFFEVNAIKEINQSYITKRETIRRIRDEILNNQGLNEGDITKIKISRDVTQEIDGEEITKSIEINVLEFFSLIEARVSDQLIRNLDNEFLLGTHKIFGVNQPFILFSIKNRDFVYSNMFLWEEYMVSDIRDIFFSKLGSSVSFQERPEIKSESESAPDAVPVGSTTNSTTSTSTASSTPTQTQEVYVNPRPSLNYDPLKFTDVILSNKDTRAIVSDSGEILFFYSIIDSKRLLLANNLQTLEEITRKIKNANIVK